PGGAPVRPLVAPRGDVPAPPPGSALEPSAPGRASPCGPFPLATTLVARALTRSRAPEAPMTNPAPSKLDNLRGDVLGGITAGIVALPLALGFGHASGLGAAAGLYGAIALGILAALFGGTPSQVSGPTGPMTVVAAGLAVSIAAAGGDASLIFLAVILAGGLQIGLGVLRL